MKGLLVSVIFLIFLLWKFRSHYFFIHFYKEITFFVNCWNFTCSKSILVEYKTLQKLKLDKRKEKLKEKNKRKNEF